MGLRHDKNRARATQQIDAVRSMAMTGNIGATGWNKGLTAKDMYDLRLACRKAGVDIKVIRNRLAQRALENTNFVCLQSALKGPVLLFFSQNEPKVLAGLLRDFSKTHDKLVVQNLAFEGKLLPASELDRMANLPTKEEAVSMLLAVLQQPIKQLLSVLSEPQIRLVRSLMAINKSH